MMDQWSLTKKVWNRFAFRPRKKPTLCTTTTWLLTALPIETLTEKLKDMEETTTSQQPTLEGMELVVSHIGEQFWSDLVEANLIARLRIFALQNGSTRVDLERDKTTVLSWLTKKSDGDTRTPTTEQIPPFTDPGMLRLSESRWGDYGESEWSIVVTRIEEDEEDGKYCKPTIISSYWISHRDGATKASYLLPDDPADICHTSVVLTPGVLDTMHSDPGLQQYLGNRITWVEEWQNRRVGSATGELDKPERSRSLDSISTSRPRGIQEAEK